MTLHVRETDGNRRKALSPADPVGKLVGVGGVLSGALQQCGISSVKDLLGVLPRRYEDLSEFTRLSDIQAEGRIVTEGVIVSARPSLMNGRRGFEVRLRESTSSAKPELRLVWFRTAGLLQTFRVGRRVQVSGAVKSIRSSWTMAHPEVLFLDDDVMEKSVPGIVPRYPKIENVPAKTFVKLMRQAVSICAERLTSVVPDWLCDEHHLMTLSKALVALHHPPATLGAEELATWNQHGSAAHERLILEEFLVLEIVLQYTRRSATAMKAPTLFPASSPLEHAGRLLPFQLTHAQKRVYEEIARDLESGRPMRRLLQGDVGSGKTAVAVLSALHAVLADSQVAFMAPTEILAEQHFEAMRPFAEALSLRMVLLTSRDSASMAEIHQSIQQGSADVVVGTHALLSQGVRFKTLSLVVIDEQHRFGVGHRRGLLQKGLGSSKTEPHLLVMTATPIPRTLALTLYGDLDVSIIDEMPEGRFPPVTRLYRGHDRRAAYDVVRRALAKDGRAYVVCPALRPSQDGDLRSAEEVYAELKPEFVDAGVELMYGGMPVVQRQAILDRFKSGTTKVLVATTVIEVGLDVPSANVIVVEQAERFGLAQLHQLRGRVGRAGQRSACLLITKTASAEAKDRLRILKTVQDGFRIAEEDLKLRGPGELLGERQSGFDALRFGDPIRDIGLLLQSRDMARRILDRDPDLSEPCHQTLRDEMRRFMRQHGFTKPDFAN